MARLRIVKPMVDCLREAFNKNAIIGSDGLDSDEHIHVFEGCAYYEDGAHLGCFGEALDLLSNMKWTSHYEWFVIKYLNEDEVKKLAEIRKNFRDMRDSDYLKSELNKLIKGE